MKNEDVKNEFLDQQTYINLGIKNYSEKQSSYPKWLSNNHYLAYDNDSIYLVDKLHLTFTTDYTSNHFYELNNYQLNPDNYYLTEFISFEKNKSRVDFANNYLIVVSGLTYGNILYDHSNVTSRVQVELNNQFLYSNSSYDIIENLNKISHLLNLKYKNVSRYELARDSTTDIYHDYTMVYYQSDFCALQVHEAHDSKPIFSSYGRLTYTPIVPDKKNKKYGTAYIGKSESAIQVKMYSKSNEIYSMAKRKNYISKVHQKHFGTYNNITRVEARINSSTVNKYKLDLFDLLNPKKHIELFYTLVDDKLTFKRLLTKRWDKNKNDKYESLKLLPSRCTNNSIKEISIQPQPVKVHNNNVNKFKINIHSFLDDEMNCFGIQGSIKTYIWDNDITPSNAEIVTRNIYQKHKNPINNIIKKKQRFIKDIIESKGHKFKVAKAYWNYLV
jgi:hypothetical protein